MSNARHQSRTVKVRKIKNAIAKAAFESQTRIQLNTNEISNLLKGYRDSLDCIYHNSLTRKLESALYRCRKQMKKKVVDNLAAIEREL